MREAPGVRVTLVGVRVQDRPVPVHLLPGSSRRFTVPGNALTDETVIVAVTAEPALVVKVTGFAVIVKSGTAMLNVTVVV